MRKPVQLIDQYSRMTLNTAAETRAIETAWATNLPPHELMDRAGVSVAKLTKALAPHARSIWVACGPGNNGGDGMAAAAYLQTWANFNCISLTVTWCGCEAKASPDTLWARRHARSMGVQFADTPPAECDVVIDAVLGLGIRQAGTTSWNSSTNNLIRSVHALGTLCICVDLPSGLNPDSGVFDIARNQWTARNKRTVTLSLLTVKPGLFTAQGRDSVGEVWFDDLGSSSASLPLQSLGTQSHPCLHLGPIPSATGVSATPPHDSHKGSQGDVWVVGGQQRSVKQAGMTGAAVLAARAALHHGAGRVFVIPLGREPNTNWDPIQPELMFRSDDTISASEKLAYGCWVCGCGGGGLVKKHIAKIAGDAAAMVVDADALNAIACDENLKQALAARETEGRITVLTPHPLEAARLLGTTAIDVQRDRISSAFEIAQRYRAVCVLKGSGTITAAPSGVVAVNPSGNGRLATAGTGDVLAGMLGAALAKHIASHARAIHGTIEQGLLGNNDVPGIVSTVVWLHGLTANHWLEEHGTLTASQLLKKASYR